MVVFGEAWSAPTLLLALASFSEYLPSSDDVDRYSFQNSLTKLMRIARSTNHWLPGFTCAKNRTPTVHGIPTVVGSVTFTAGCTVNAPHTTSSIFGSVNAASAAFVARSTASSTVDDSNNGICMVTTADDQ